MITKEKVLQTLKEMPEQFSIDDLMEKLILINKIEIGIEQVGKGETYTSSEAKKMIKEWSK
ncbi:hypothetical protein SAMN00777080_0146 [Aquiflexum balticum DSM 16537]|jgi:hypothetical protein|uniref:Uncharacterized protein n=2 Tax=Aquiflexum TaxID=280472 RepID=A0A1W2GY41_9BACT|nr:hypothetical protein [Aquiflexum balticum]SMD41620.1 hypothetical protein SAMN00777080_0146 [Aquiflexum balticum DSM 16537]